MRTTIMVFIAGILAIVWCHSGFAESKADSLITNKIQRIAKQHHCIVGVAAIHIETKKKVSYNGEVPFFMASTVKVPIASTLLKRVDQHEEQLDRIIRVKPTDAVPGSGTLYEELTNHPTTHKLSLRQLLYLMLQVSDNTATDLVLNEIAGPKAVLRHLKALGLHHIFVNRSIFNLYISSSGLPYYSDELHDKNKFTKALTKVKPQQKIVAWKTLTTGKRDTTTADEMAQLLVALYEGKVLSPESTRLLFDIMGQCQTGKNRIKGLLPPCTKVAHKTGTWTENFSSYTGYRQLYHYVNDIGVMTLPHHKGHVAIAVYVKSKGNANLRREQAIACISRELYRYFQQ